MDCSAGFYGRFCNISCDPGSFGKFCAGNCTSICSPEECDPFYGCKLTTGNLIRPTNSECTQGFYGRFCNISCNPGFFGRSCAGNCTPICTLEECDPVYGCNLTTGNVIRPTSSAPRWESKIKRYYINENRSGW
ncbi:uncharacterized protein LOC111105583 [Crassostrea virginica]